MKYAWLPFALLSAICASLVAIFGKIGLKNIDSNTATAIRAVIMALFLIVVILAQGKLGQIPVIVSNKKAITFITLSGVAGALSWLFYFIALKLGKVSQVAPIDKLSVVFAAILAIIVLHEKISKLNGLGIGFIAIGALIIALS